MTNTLMGRVSAEGRLQLLNLSGWRGLLKHLAGKTVVVTIAPYRKRRSVNQNAYFHGVICELISDHTGYEVDEVKEILKHMFLFVDEPYPHARPTSRLNTAEMAEFTDRCIRWAAQELGIVLPLPNEGNL